MELFRLHNWRLYVRALNSFTEMSSAHPFFFCDQSAKVGLVTLHLPLLPLSLLNHSPTCFICLGSECAAVSTENPPAQPGQLFPAFRGKHQCFIFQCSPLMVLHLDDGSGEQYGDGLSVPCLSDHKLDTPSFHASRQRPGIKLLWCQACSFQQTQEGSARAAAQQMETSLLLSYLWWTFLNDIIAVMSRSTHSLAVHLLILLSARSEEVHSSNEVGPLQPDLTRKTWKPMLRLSSGGSSNSQTNTGLWPRKELSVSSVKPKVSADLF